MSNTIATLLILFASSCGLFAKDARKLLFFYQAPEEVSRDRKLSEKAMVTFFAKGASAMEKVTLYPNTVSFDIEIPSDAATVEIYRSQSDSEEEEAFKLWSKVSLTDSSSNQLVFIAPDSKGRPQFKAFNISTKDIPKDSHCLLNISAQDLAFRCANKQQLIKKGQKLIYKATPQQGDAIRFLFSVRDGEKWKPRKTYLTTAVPKSQKLLLLTGATKNLSVRTLTLSHPREGYDLEMQRKYNEPARDE
ncbi:hypothetical protein [Roseibacillus persicicus]|uniref:Uncharacterized protein n=1 Tax=Roseibacillus persicicus TaxID=454148 RepID=A0A918WGA7_9BACT|nr:hypothetical protein [Roseibacillus persicicus]GHC44955.1 hypothetical protein GCM10007100_07840 [Roseibacillus persicicus]